jgi:copper transport protein
MRALWLLATVSVAVAALAAAPAASAHAELLGTRPAAGAVVEDAREVVLSFSEPVETALGKVQVFDPTARRVDEGALTQPSSREVAVRLRTGLARGTYVVRWQVISADGHRLRGAYGFGVGSEGDQVPTPILTADETRSVVADVAFTVTRFLVFALILLCFGGAVVLASVVRPDDAVDAVRRRLFAGLALAAGGLAAVSLVGLPLQASSVGGLPLRDAVRWRTVSALLDTRFGQMWVWRAWVALTLVVLALVARRRHELPVPTTIVAAMLAVTPAAAGHAIVAGPLPFVSDVVHVLAAGAWAGGLSFLVAALVLARDDRLRLASRSVQRFSSIAVLALGALVVTGVTSAYFEVLEGRGLWETTYGRLLVAKVAIVLPVLALGAHNNRIAVRRLRDESASTQDQRRFLHTAAAELALLVVVVGVTAVLVNQPPPRTELEPQRSSASRAPSAISTTPVTASVTRRKVRLRATTPTISV